VGQRRLLDHRCGRSRRAHPGRSGDAVDRPRSTPATRQARRPAAAVAAPTRTGDPQRLASAQPPVHWSR
jgi:hypothetical protein